ncbi:MAG: methionyl-tRNA formyltransferase [Actinomycetes bacterium]
MTSSVPEFPKRLVYLGTPDMAVAPLEALVAAGFEIALVVSRADTRRGRGGQPSPSPVKAAALSLGLPVSDQVDDALTVGADLGVVVAYGRIIAVDVLEQLPMVNLHFSLLPRWRGAAPVERALLAGDQVTGVCLMEVCEGLDTGAVFDRRELAIGDEESGDELRRRLVAVGSDLLLDSLRRGLRDPQPQVGEPIYAKKLVADELCIDWSQPADNVGRVIRLGGAWTTFRGKRMKVWEARADTENLRADLGPGRIDGVMVGTGTTAIELIEVQPEGRGRQHVQAWRNGSQPTADERFAQ